MLRIAGASLALLVMGISSNAAIAQNCGKDPLDGVTSLAELNALPKNAWLQYQRCIANQGDSEAQLKMGIAYRDGSDGPPKDLAAAFKWFQLSAKQGNQYAQLNLGMLYDNSQGVAQDYAKAVSWYRKAVKQGSVTAKYRLAYHYFYGFGVPKNTAKASELYKQAKAKAEFANEFALAHYQDGSNAAAIRWIRFVAEQGDASAQNSLGIMYGNGQGMTQGYAEAVKWFRQAAVQGDASAQSNLGVMYDNGQGVPQDYAKAVKWYRKAAEQGVAIAQFNLGVMYTNGHGVPQDYVEAHLWFNLAATQGNQDAINNRDVIAAKMTPADISKAQARARKWFEIHKNQ